MVDEGKLRPVIGAVLELADIAQAHTCWKAALAARVVDAHAARSPSLCTSECAG
ncbi:hypothetical protein [Kribbella italica]|uniref:hypothetical protein n=1 Tax=Kribbella italica TaxID=1540520 RepID=UPI003B58B33B